MKRFAPLLFAVGLTSSAATSGCSRDVPSTNTTGSTTRSTEGIATTSPATSPTTGGVATSSSSAGTSSTTSTATTAPGTDTTSSSTTTRPPDGDGGSGALDGADTSAKTGGSENVPTALVTDIRNAGYDGYEQIVFQFASDIPGYAIRYVEKPIHSDGSGEVVPLAGNYALEVRMFPASGVDMANDAQPTYTGPSRITIGRNGVIEAVRNGDFEAVLHWTIGLSTKAPFRVTTKTAPAQIVIDIRDH